MVLPRYMIDSRQENTDTKFQVMIDGTPADYQEGELITSSEDGSQSRQITAFIPAGSTMLDVIGTQVLSNLEQ